LHERHLKVTLEISLRHTLKLDNLSKTLPFPQLTATKPDYVHVSLHVNQTNADSSQVVLNCS